MDTVAAPIITAALVAKTVLVSSLPKTDSTFRRTAAAEATRPTMLSVSTLALDHVARRLVIVVAPLLTVVLDVRMAIARQVLQCLHRYLLRRLYPVAFLCQLMVFVVLKMATRPALALRTVLAARLTATVVQDPTIAAQDVRTGIAVTLHQRIQHKQLNPLLFHRSMDPAVTAIAITVWNRGTVVQRIAHPTAFPIRILPIVTTTGIYRCRLMMVHRISPMSLSTI